jgi:hypothetical protein
MSGCRLNSYGRDQFMKLIEMLERRWDFYDPNKTALGELKWLAGAVCLFFLLCTSFWWAPLHLQVQVISCFLCPVILLSLPRLTRSAFFAYQGAPLFCFNEQGLWARDWSYFGWIDWRDVTLVKITSDHSGLRHSVEVQLTDEELAHLTFSDRVCRVLVDGLGRFLQGRQDGQNTLQIACRSELRCLDTDFKTTINHVLSNANVPCTWKQTFS